MKRLLLDVLAPHEPNVLELGRVLAGQGESHVRLSVVEMDDQTQTLQIDIESPKAAQVRAGVRSSKFQDVTHPSR